MDQREFRRVMGQFATGVTVVTTRTGDLLQGITVNAFTSVSLEPMLVLVCIERKALCHAAIANSGIFAVNVLAEDQVHLSELFARRTCTDAERFNRVRYHTEATGAPLLEGTLAQIDCRVVAAYDGGDHTLFLGSVQWMGLGDARDPLLFFGGRYGVLAEPEPVRAAA